MTFTKYGAVIGLGNSGEFDFVTIDYSTLVYVSGRFYCFYAAYGGAGYKIGLAVSRDGFTWTKYGVVIDNGAVGEFDSAGVYNSSVIYHNGLFYLYYIGGSAGRYTIGLAKSRDGVAWTKYGRVIDYGITGEFDASGLGGMSVIFYHGKFWMYYTGYGNSKYTVGLAISSDGFTWTKYGRVVDIGSGSDFDLNAVRDPSVIQRDGLLCMYYQGEKGTVKSIGLAKSRDGLTWTKYGAVVTKGSGAEFDASGAFSPYAVNLHDKTLMMYNGSLSTVDTLGLAVSPDGF